MKKILILSELFVPPYDEGMKVTTLNLLKGIRSHVDCIGLGPCGGLNGMVRTVTMNKFMYSKSLQNEIKRYLPDFIFYIPEASATLNSFMRYRILQFVANGIDTSMIALQNRELSYLSQRVIKLSNPSAIFVTSNYMFKIFNKIGIVTHLLPMGVDIEKFVPAAEEKKCMLRDKYNLPKNRYIILHVGHIKESRNIKIFLNLANNPDYQVLLVGSTSTQQKDGLKEELQQSGIRIMDNYVTENQELYQLADCYVFCVTDRAGAMEFPLSVLEAMACNLPVLTTPFGSLPENFAATYDFRYFKNVDELKTGLQEIETVVSETRERVEKYSWNSIAEHLLRECDILQ